MAAEIAFLIRHGEYNTGYSTNILTPGGIEQSLTARGELLSRQLGGRAYLLSSDADRAMETARIINEGLQVELVPSAKLRRASNTRNVVDVLGTFLRTTLEEETGQEVDPDRPFVAVVHAPLIMAMTGIPEASYVGHGEVYPIPMAQTDPLYRGDDFAEFILSGALE